MANKKIVAFPGVEGKDAPHVRRPGEDIPKGNYGTVIRQYRLKAGMDQETLGKRVGYTKNAVHNWETGKTRPDLDVVPVVCRILNIPLELFFQVPSRPALTREARRLAEGYMSLNRYHRQSLMLMCESLQEAETHETAQRFRKEYVPVTDMLLAASAGTGASLAEDDLSDRVYVRKENMPAGTDAVFHVSGHSMEPTFHDGDRVFVQYADRIQKGRIGIFLINGESYIKELGEGKLISHNPEYLDILLTPGDSIRCIGQVIGTVGEDDLASPELLRRVDLTDENE